MVEVSKDAVIKKVFIKLMPVLFISYILAYVDRINIGFAALKMNTDLGISPYIYMGLAREFFFLGTSSLRCPATSC